MEEYSQPSLDGMGGEIASSCRQVVWTELHKSLATYYALLFAEPCPPLLKNGVLKHRV
jgi:hypothetical protein